MTSATPAGPGRGAGALFPQTSWTLLAEACAGGTIGEAARSELAARYYKPIHAYITAIFRDAEEAQELTQSFFERSILSGRLLRAADRTKGSFRPFLKQALRNFVTDHFRKRPRGMSASVRPDADSDGWDQIVSDTGPGSPEVVYHGAWVRSLLEVALEKVRETCARRGQQQHFELFAARYLDHAGTAPSWRALGEPYGLDEKAARNRTETVARHFRLVLRQMLAEETGSGQAADEEIAALLGALE